MVILLSLVATLSVLAEASEPQTPVIAPISGVDKDPRPLAIPMGPSPAPPRAVTITAPPETGSKTRAMREYRNQHLSVQRLSEIVTTTSWSYHYRYRPYRGGGGWVAWPHPWSYNVDTIAVFKGEQRLDVPSTLGELGDVAARLDLERRIGSQRSAASALQAIGVVGVGAAVVGLIGRDQASTFTELRDWSRVTEVGIGMTFGGLMLSAFPSSRARKLQYTHELTLSLDDLQRRVADHNEALAAELGLDPEVALQLEGS
ncbi:MAG TPA: hypothetical protein ENK18_19560 [Deltaproteobacteria bacterium]|nr:hypothetical protein [Deltaproteobacteria bacterium]